MAIINCPECNEKISNTAKKCIHCGAELTVCPECESVYLGDVDVCKECGFTINQKKETEEKTLFKTAKIAETAWMQSDFFVKYEKIISWAAICVYFVLIIVSLLKLYSFKSNPENILLNYNSAISDIKNLLIFSQVFYMVYEAYEEFRTLIIGEKYANWIKSKGENLKAIISKSFSLNFSKMIPKEAKEEAGSIQACIDAEIIDSDIEFKNKRILHSMIKTILGLLSGLLLLFFLLKNLEIYMQAQLLKSDLLNIPGWSLSMVENWWQIICVFIIFVIKCMLNYKSNTKLEKIRRKWVEVNMPDNLKKYDKYVKDPSAYYIDKSVEISGREL